MTVSSSYKALAPGRQVFFLAKDGLEPYIYSVQSGGAGGAIDPSTGLYTAPASPPTDPAKQFDTIRATADNGEFVNTRIFVGDALGLFCDVLQTELGLADGRVYVYNQKILTPNDAGLFVAVGIVDAKPFGNTNRYTTPDQASDVLNSVQSVNMQTTLLVNAVSRDRSALLRKEEIILALNSDYAQSQMELNSFLIGKLPMGGRFVNISELDGAAIPYRFAISVNIQYFVSKTKAVPFFNEFQDVNIETEP